MAFLPFGNSDHVAGSVSIDFTINSKQDASFHRIAYDYSRADWDSLRDHLRDVLWGNISKLNASTAPGELYEWLQVGIDVYTPHCKYQVKPCSSTWLLAACPAAIGHRNHFFVCTNRINLLNLIYSLSRLVIVVKGFLKLPNLHMLLKQKSPSLTRNLALMTFDKLLIVFSTKANLLYHMYSMDWRCCLLHLTKQSHLLKTFLRTLILATPTFLPVFLSRTNLKLDNISITTKMVQKGITNFDSSKASCPDCIPVVVLKDCDPELSYILAELFNICLNESCFPECWKVSSVVPVFTNVGEISTAKNHHPVSFLSVISKVFEKLVNNRIADHLEQRGLFSNFQYDFRSS